MAAADHIERWHAGLGTAISMLGTSDFPAVLERALRQLVSFEMMNGFVYAPGGRAFDLENARIVGDRTTIVDHYLAGAYILAPFYDAIRNPPADGVLVMRKLAPDRFTDTEYYRRHYRATGIVDEVGFMFKLGPADAVLSLRASVKCRSSRVAMSPGSPAPHLSSELSVSGIGVTASIR